MALRNPKPKPRAVDLFSGCGGLTLGLKKAGFAVIGAVEKDRLAVDTYCANHPEVYVWNRDIRYLTAPQLLRELGLKVGELELLAGCPPCQGFSALRRLNGGRRVRDSDNNLVYDFLRMVKGIRPKAVLMENVPGLARDARLAKLKLALRRIGYFVKTDIKDARNYGVPQRRRRLLLVAGHKFAIPFARPARKTRTVREAFRSLSKKRAKADVLHNLPETRSSRVIKLIKLIPKNGGSRRDLGEEHQLPCHNKCDGFSDVYGRMNLDDVAPTITGGCCNPSKGRFLHPTANRNISLREAALLQTFPLTYSFSLEEGKFSAAQMIGNALPPEFVRRQAVEIHKALKALRSE